MQKASSIFCCFGANPPTDGRGLFPDGLGWSKKAKTITKYLPYRLGSGKFTWKDLGAVTAKPDLTG